MAGMSRIADGELNQYVSNANEVIHFKLIKDISDLNDDSDTFEPEFSHQFFGESENIFGYKGLKITLYYSSAKLYQYFQMTYSDKVKSSLTGGIEADDAYKIISDKLELKPSLNLDNFSSLLTKETTFKPFGERLMQKTLKNEMNEQHTYEIYRANMDIPGFREYHSRMQTFILWFIDAASYIDVDDSRWDYFVMHEVIKGSETLYPFVGYSTVYKYYAYPTKIRPRISQMLILPPFQKCGLGTKLLETINNFYISDSNVLDITVEDPSDNFIHLRDFVDCKNCMTLLSYSNENLKLGFNDNMQKEAREKFKINKKQARRIYEILRLKNTNISDADDYKAYRIEIKNRLNVPFQKQKLEMQKLEKTLSPEELKATVNTISREKRIEQLEHLYNDLENEYKQVIERLNLDN